MHESDRVKLLGRYRTPRFRYGDVASCAMRGDMKIVGLSNARIPWPKPFAWTPARDWLLGTMSDVDLGRRLRCPPMAVFYRRKRLGIPAHRA